MNDLPPHHSTDQDLMRQHGQGVWAVVVRVLGDDGHDAADCFQQTFLQYVAQVDRGQTATNPSALLKRIAAARAIDLVRRRMRERGRTADSDPDGYPAARSVPPEAAIEAEELRASLRVALTNIPDDQATAFVLTAIEDISYEAAASAMGVTQNHLGVLLFRARKALQSKLSDYAPERRIQR